MELEIVDALLPDLEEEVMDVNLVQRMHKSGRKVNFRVIVAVGNKNGYVGLGQGKAREVGPAIRKAVDNAKYNIINLPQGTHSTFRAGSCLWMPGRFLTPVPVAETQGLIFLGWSGTQAHHHCLGLLSTPADAESSLRLHCIFHLGPGGGCLALAFCWGSPPPPPGWPHGL